MQNLPHGFDLYYVLANVKIMRNSAQIFVAFSQKLNFSMDVQIGAGRHLMGFSLASLSGATELYASSVKNNKQNGSFLSEFLGGFAKNSSDKRLKSVYILAHKPQPQIRPMPKGARCLRVLEYKECL